ncbi:hypothetical protein [Xenorhabdus szentirmaii]|uniref:Uncharacterized protein n=1 Tax=Xenorhabdus szentirmaii DSM 16338 TaxID=1427518 RepID=W1IRX0_9GAMM|nr:MULTISPECIES: hypothetical protein [Xenorhabdus]MBD2791545.1 hypothetical protein [Xenorhabdus sp. CUL]PHM32565.1 hypothetical protein Xsze_03312 [Xenorhabdus szentirmaii DSM 16338]PHM41127.1 hypothetical protein Xszus_00804 [Xenorhabdus szentirmaii]CDL80578.1 hypothetical protein XSR1_10058 [Xenorhabdus szentirmaii DSM 16338]
MSDKDITIVTLKVDSKEIKFEIPSYICELISIEENNFIPLQSHYSESLEKILRTFIPDSIRPATKKQVDFMRSIAETLNITISEKQLKNSTAARKFISQYIDEFNNKKDEEKIAEINNSKHHKERLKRQMSYYTSIAKTYVLSFGIKELSDAGIGAEEISEITGLNPSAIKRSLEKLNNLLNRKKDDEQSYILRIAYYMHKNDEYADIDNITDDLLEQLIVMTIKNKDDKKDWFYKL